MQEQLCRLRTDHNSTSALVVHTSRRGMTPEFKPKPPSEMT